MSAWCMVMPASGTSATIISSFSKASVRQRLPEARQLAPFSPAKMPIFQPFLPYCGNQSSLRLCW